MSTSILHLSDLHLGVQHSIERMQKLTDAIITQFADTSRPVIVMSGDLVDNPFGKGYRYLEPFLDRLSMAGFSVLAIPGNHDYGIGFFNWPPFERKFRRTFLPFPDAGYPRLDIISDTAFIGLDSCAAELGLFDFLGS
jgi:3',5'-cyclic AMP phosphodiesterase CpdA